MSKKKKIVIWVISVVALLVVGGGTAFSFMNRGAEVAGSEMEEMPVTVQKVKEQELIETILVTGEIVPEGEQKVYLEPEKGEISEYKVKENQKVKAGDPLFVYDSSKLEVEFTRSVRERDLIQSRGKTELNQIADMDKQIAEAKKNLGKPAKKVESPVAETSTKDDTATAGEQAESVVQETVDEFQVTQADINQLMNEKVQLEIQYESTKSEIASAQEQINEIDTQKKEMTVVSKIDGVVVKVDQNVAQTEAGSAEPVVHLISSQPYKVIGTMSEFDAVKIKKDQEVVIRPKVYKDREWKGKIESVSQFPNEEGGGGEDMMMGGGGAVTMYPFKVAITDDTSELRQGFHVSLEIKISSAEKPIVVPHSALIDEEGIDIVYVLVDGILERREVHTGSMNDEFIAVEDGVNLDELVVIFPDEGMYDGMEVISFDEVE